MIAVVTGASAGIGRAVAEEFAARGCDVAILARNEARLDAAAAELRRRGVRALPIVADVADAEAMETAAERVEARLGPIDIWVNNAMATIFAPFDRISPEEFRRGTEVTYLGQVHGTMAALPRMRKRDRGTIVNVGSALAYRAIPLQSVYCGAKYAVRGFTDSLRTELLHDGSPVRAADCVASIRRSTRSGGGRSRCRRSSSRRCRRARSSRRRCIRGGARCGSGCRR